ncbi:MAG: oligosaccharide flippase family protein [Lachnospiraceae bacterium]|nr:oligosaccharide flippase family protein [Lachnospiraceae bacterium]MDE7200525.1 oligosaccharide flippase family protein [Lachnospiraceae bacterium]
MKKFLLGSPDNILKNSYIWNTIGGLLNAGQSALLLIVISRTNPVEDAGVFSIAYAIACLTVTVGKWGMRNFQATDVLDKYDYSIYASSRVITCILMMALTIFYIFKGILISNYSIEKCCVILLMGMLKLLDAVEDIIHGMFQRKGRLDVGAKGMATRYIVMLFVCIISLILTGSLVGSLGVAFLISTLYFVLTVLSVYDEFKEKVSVSFTDRDVWRLLAECFSLFAGSFLMIYIANAPKYAIDEYMTEVVQACFNYIFMPVYVISVLNTFVYQPVLTKLAIYYEGNQYKEFLYLFLRQLFIIFGLALGVIVCGYLLGIPVLTFLYNIDLSEYKQSFIILLVGGSFLAISGYLSVVITILRKQNWLLIGYVSAAVIAFFAAKPLTLSWGVTGAAFLYTGIVLLQSLIFAAIFMKFCRGIRLK